MNELILKYCVIEKDDVIYKIESENIYIVFANVINTPFGFYQILGIIDGVGITKFKGNNYETN